VSDELFEEIVCSGGTTLSERFGGDPEFGREGIESGLRIVDPPKHESVNEIGGRERALSADEMALVGDALGVVGEQLLECAC